MQNHIAGHLLSPAFMSLPLSWQKQNDPGDESTKSSGTVLRSDFSNDLQALKCAAGTSDQQEAARIIQRYYRSYRRRLDPPATETESMVERCFRSRSLGSFDSAAPALNRFTEKDIRLVSEFLLLTGHESWSPYPRLYSVLRLVNRSSAMDALISEGFPEFWLPFTEETLPKRVKEALLTRLTRLEFLKAQHFVLTPELEEYIEDGKHRHYLDNGDVPLVNLGPLRKDAWGSIDRVQALVASMNMQGRFCVGRPQASMSVSRMISRSLNGSPMSTLFD
jgi:hypothetical protein